MSARHDARAVEILDAVVGQVHERVPGDQAALAEAFVRRFYAGTAA